MTETEICEAVKANDRIRPFGGSTKPRLSASSGTTYRLDLRKHHGITEYQSSEYTITARAGTTIRELQQTLAEKGQYLPFDPLWAEAGATARSPPTRPDRVDSDLVACGTLLSA